MTGIGKKQNSGEVFRLIRFGNFRQSGGQIRAHAELLILRHDGKLEVGDLGGFLAEAHQLRRVFILQQGGERFAARRSAGLFHGIPRQLGARSGCKVINRLAQLRGERLVKNLIRCFRQKGSAIQHPLGHLAGLFQLRLGLAGLPLVHGISGFLQAGEEGIIHLLVQVCGDLLRVGGHVALLAQRLAQGFGDFGHFLDQGGDGGLLTVEQRCLRLGSESIREIQAGDGLVESGRDIGEFGELRLQPRMVFHGLVAIKCRQGKFLGHRHLGIGNLHRAGIINQHHHLALNGARGIAGENRLHKNRQNRGDCCESESQQPTTKAGGDDPFFELINNHGEFNGHGADEGIGPERPGGLQQEMTRNSLVENPERDGADYDASRQQAQLEGARGEAVFENMGEIPDDKQGGSRSPHHRGGDGIVEKVRADIGIGRHGRKAGGKMDGSSGVGLLDFRELVGELFGGGKLVLEVETDFLARPAVQGDPACERDFSQQDKQRADREVSPQFLAEFAPCQNVGDVLGSLWLEEFEMILHHCQIAFRPGGEMRFCGIIRDGKWDGAIGGGQLREIGTACLRHPDAVGAGDDIAAEPGDESALGVEKLGVPVDVIGSGDRQGSGQGFLVLRSGHEGQQGIRLDRPAGLELRVGGAPTEVETGTAVGVGVFQSDRHIFAGFQLDFAIPTLGNEALVVDPEVDFIIAPAFEDVFVGIFWEQGTGVADAEVVRFHPPWQRLAVEIAFRSTFHTRGKCRRCESLVLEILHFEAAFPAIFHQ